MFFWTNPDSNVTHRVKDKGMFLETYCGITLSKTKNSVHENADVRCHCGDCTLVYERGYGVIDNHADNFAQSDDYERNWS